MCTGGTVAVVSVKSVCAEELIVERNLVVVDGTAVGCDVNGERNVVRCVVGFDIVVGVPDVEYDMTAIVVASASLNVVLCSVDAEVAPLDTEVLPEEVQVSADALTSRSESGS